MTKTTFTQFKSTSSRFTTTTLFTALKYRKWVNEPKLIIAVIKMCIDNKAF